MMAGIVTAILLLLFIGGWIYVWSPRRKAEFDAAARLPLDDTPPDNPPAMAKSNKEQSA